MIVLNGNTLTLEALVAVARYNVSVQISDESKSLVLKSSDFVMHIAKQNHAIYGINTGFGHLSNVMIKHEEIEKLQTNLLKSHACGMGEPLDIEIVRAMLALRINALIKGYSGIRLETIEMMLMLLNAQITPVVFEKGSLGASGDLALLSHMSLPLIGLGEVFYKGKRFDTMTLFKKLNIKPLRTLAAKEGLSLINGTQAMTAIGALVLYDAYRLEKLASVSLSMSMEALEGIIDAFDPKVHETRGQLGQIKVAQRVRDILKSSKNITRQGQKRIQDAYSIRCAPQVHGASLDAFDHIHTLLKREMNAVTDNPIVFVDEKEVISAGNFHGQPMALAFDYLAIALSELANISERRIERMVNPQLSNGLPPFLTVFSGVNSGFMIIQYTAASIVSENKVLAHPASVDSIPSSANQEDHVSMGTFAARKAKTILDNVYKVIALEFLTATQAISLRGKNNLSEVTKNAYQQIKAFCPDVESDVVLYPYMHKTEALIKNPDFFDALHLKEDQ